MGMNVVFLNSADESNTKKRLDRMDHKAGIVFSINTLNCIVQWNNRPSEL